MSSKLPLEIRWHLAERRAERLYENDPASGLGCGPLKVNMTGDRFWAHKSVWVFQFGACATTHVLAYGYLENALEDAAAWLAKHAPGHLTEPDYEQAEHELQQDSLSGEHPLPDDPDLRQDAICQRAESGLTYTESGWLLSHEWTATELREPGDLLAYVTRK